MGRVSDARQRLLDAANELTGRLGYNAVTVDAICEHAGVKKGSFYHYFESKAALGEAAIDDWWQTKSRPRLETSFAADVPPLERIQRYLDSLHAAQVERKRKGEQVLGCLGFSVAMEGAGVDPEVLEATQRVLQRKRRYFETAIRDAQAAGLIKVPDVEVATQAVYSLFEGAMARARIQNNPELMVGLYEQILLLLGTAQPERKRA
ncbi:MAG TPA: TetR/AcrR family transcriptional regulator [Gammaproteobacteria bacterium]|nr:TetR/AcrR family transcriptional regulator [Gammaproteobacteria bacterium]